MSEVEGVRCWIFEGRSEAGNNFISILLMWRCYASSVSRWPQLHICAIVVGTSATEHPTLQLGFERFFRQVRACNVEWRWKYIFINIVQTHIMCWCQQPSPQLSHTQGHPHPTGVISTPPLALFIKPIICVSTNQCLRIVFTFAHDCMLCANNAKADRLQRVLPLQNLSLVWAVELSRTIDD